MMIDSKELRIGNWVLENGRSEKQITAITDDYALTSTPGVQNIDPIPLTEEWLLKLCVEEKATCYYFRSFVIYYREDKRFIPVIGIYELEELKYVHQLQNLYFALTGEELQIKK